MSHDAPKPIQSLDARGLRVAAVVSRFNSEITDRLLQGAREEFARLGGEANSLSVVRAPGAYELPIVAAELAKTGEFDAIVALGCLIKGETLHDRVIAGAVADGLLRVALEHHLPVALGVLTVDTMEQAMARSGGSHGNRGANAMNAAIETARTLALQRRQV